MTKRSKTAGAVHATLSYICTKLHNRPPGWLLMKVKLRRCRWAQPLPGSMWI